MLIGKFYIQETLLGIYLSQQCLSQACCFNLDEFLALISSPNGLVSLLSGDHSLSAALSKNSVYTQLLILAKSMQLWQFAEIIGD